MPLSDTAIRKAKPSAKPTRFFDGGGLYLQVSPAGAKLWRFKYRFDGKERLLALGAYPHVTLAAARKRRDDARNLLADGIDPSEQRKAAKATRAGLAANTFEVIGREWYAKTAPMLAENTKTKLLRFLEVDVFPWIGARPIASLAAADLIKVIERIEQRGAMDIARRVHNYIGRIFRYAVGRGLATRDPSRDIELKDILPPEDVQHHASVTDPKAVGGLLRAIDGFTGAFGTRCALRLAALAFVRPGELRHAEWTEFDFEKAEWRIPAGKMKMKEQHIVPLSDQAIGVLREIQPLTGSGRYVFAKRARRQQTHEREYRERGAAPNGIRQGRNDGAWLSQHGINPVARTWITSCRNRAAASARRAQQGIGCVQLRGAPARATQDDADMGGLSGQAQDWRGSDPVAWADGVSSNNG